MPQHPDGQPVPAQPAPGASPWLRRARDVAALFSLGAILALAYARSFQAGLVVDNISRISRDPRIEHATWDAVRLIFTQDYWWPSDIGGLYRPLTTLSYLFNYAILGDQTTPTGYHVVNFALHWANTFLVHRLLLALAGNFWVAWLGAAVFGAHPITVEAVTNVVGRADLLATLTVLGGFLLYRRSTLAEAWRRRCWLLALMLAVLLGVFCKENAVVVVGVMALYDLTYRLPAVERPWWRRAGAVWRQFAAGYAVVLPAVLGLFTVRAIIASTSPPPNFPFVDNPLLGAGFVSARMTAIKVMAKGLLLLLWPRTLSSDYSYDQIPLYRGTLDTWEDWKAILALAAILGILGVAIWSWRRNKAVFFLIAFFFVTSLPTANLVMRIGTIMAERSLYLPSVAFAGCVSIGVRTLCERLLGRQPATRRQLAAGIVLGTIVVALAARTSARNLDWRTDLSLWTSALEASPNSFKTHMGLAQAIFKSGPSGANIDRAIAEAETAVAITHKRPLPLDMRTNQPMIDLGIYYIAKGERVSERAPDRDRSPIRESRQWYRKAAAVLGRATAIDRAHDEGNRVRELARGRAPDEVPDEGVPGLYWQLSMSYLHLGKSAKALQALTHMRHLLPGNVRAHLGIAAIHAERGEAGEAVDSILQAILVAGVREEALQFLAEQFKHLDPDCPAVDRSDGEPRLNARCGALMERLCAASTQLAEAFEATKEDQLAAQMRQEAMTNCGRAGVRRIGAP